ncbi:pyrroloquinoline quinone biosynthesis peptide chaperone PqqD [Accumulibacter sp.]|uniref:pyrroloquinoline quinone biosynthesis peptide chaperone PqqD n=1 Tax=Accumulibacter sp. TaxID=2053492 RepID=UPI002C513BA6|nr:pyrroloquinoline quinone biosynthesis peptide chaperone PqqD [Accumulibacter sp.]HNH92915.1 pyrroloquinoline quinone biosynthesis peptide chaperone PqqD [Accumulibacter sp.]
MDTATLPADARPRLSPHYVFRWEESQSAFILLYPEGLIKLNASAGAILARCDGARTLATIIAELQASYPAQGAEIADGVRAFVDLACDKGWLRAA